MFQLSKVNLIAIISNDPCSVEQAKKLAMKTRIVILFILILSCFLTYAAPPAEEGKTIFAARCASCHNVNKVLTGPALAGLQDRRYMDWIMSFITSSQAMIKNGDKEAVAIFEKFNKIPMPDHKDINPDQIKGIVEYIKGESLTSANEKPPFSKLTKMRPAYIPLSFTKDYGFFIGFVLLVVLLIAALLFAVQVKQYQRLQGN